MKSRFFLRAISLFSLAGFMLVPADAGSITGSQRGGLSKSKARANRKIGEKAREQKERADEMKKEADAARKEAASARKEAARAKAQAERMQKQLAKFKEMAKKKKNVKVNVRKQKGGGGGGEMGAEGGEMGEDSGGSAKIVMFSHMLYLRDKEGTKLPCTVLMKGSKYVVVLTEEGEMEIKPDDIERITEVEGDVTPSFAVTAMDDGHIFLVPPEPEEPEEVADEGEGGDFFDEGATDTSDLLGGEEATDLLGGEEEREEEPKKEIKPVKIQKGSSLGARTINDEPSMSGGGGSISRGRPEKVTIGPVRPMDKPKDVPAKSTRPAPVKAGKPKTMEKEKAVEKEGSKGLTDLLNDLGTKEGLNSVLEQLKKNPDFYKNIDLKK